MLGFEVKFADGSVEMVFAGCEQDVWVEYDDVVSVECVGAKVRGEWV